MRFIAMGVGAIGGVVSGRLARAGHDVVLVARGAHFEAIRDRGLKVRSPGETFVVKPPIVSHPSEVAIRDGDVILLSVKSQDAAVALRDLAAVAPPSTPICCLTNGIETERLALRFFDRVFGVCVQSPSSYLVPGVVFGWAAPIAGTFDLGLALGGADALAEAVAQAFRDAGCGAEARADIMRWKRYKLLLNLGNAVEALTGGDDRGHPIALRAKAEGVACYAAAGLTTITEAEDEGRRAGWSIQSIDGETRIGGSTAQSLARGASTVESDYLNGEIALLGRAHGVPTPVNVLLQRLMGEAAQKKARPGALTGAALEAMLR